MRSLFKKPSRAMVFVDFEYWYYSLREPNPTLPDVQGFATEVFEKYNPKDIMVFGDFTCEPIKSQLRVLRNLTNTIIETGNTVKLNQKDMTDFIMLDYIYRCVDEQRDVDTYVIYTGDGHFQSVVKYLTQKKKRVVVYALRGSCSRQLEQVAPEIILTTVDEQYQNAIFTAIARNMKYVENKPGIIATCRSTLDAMTVGKKYGRDELETAINRMLQEGLLYQEDACFGSKTIKVLRADWEKLYSAGIYRKNKCFTEDIGSNKK